MVERCRDVAVRSVDLWTCVPKSLIKKNVHLVLYRSHTSFSRLALLALMTTCLSQMRKWGLGDEEAGPGSHSQ